MVLEGSFTVLLIFFGHFKYVFRLYYKKNRLIRVLNLFTFAQTQISWIVEIIYFLLILILLEAAGDDSLSHLKLCVAWPRPRTSSRSCSPPWQGWAGWRSWWVGGDLSSLKEQVEQAEATFGAKSVLQMVMKSLFWLFTKHQKGVLQPSSSLSDYCFIHFSTKLLQKLQCSSAKNLVGWVNVVECSSHGSCTSLLDMDCFVYIAALSLASKP